MLRCIQRILSHYKARHGNSGKKQVPARQAGEISQDLKQNVEKLRLMLGGSADVVIHEFSLGTGKQMSGALVLIDGLVNMELLNLSVLQPLMFDAGSIENDTAVGPDINSISKNLLSVCDVKKITSLDELVDTVLSGNTALLCDGFGEALSLSARKWEKRGVAEPSTENVVHGPRESFTETLRVNTSMLRRKIKNPNLRFDAMKIGVQTRTDVAIAYIDGIVMPGLVQEIKRRLESVQTDSVLDSGYIEAFLEDSPYSIFPTVGSSEKPDAVAGKLLEGRAAIFVDGTPFVLTAPMLFIEGFQTTEDYYIRTYYASILRAVRLLSYFLTILGPAAYVALTTFHQELIPTQLLFTLAAGHEGIPFPSLVEALMMVVTFDILREAGVRLPKAVGSAVSIVGALVLGESAVSAGLIGPFMVIVVAFTAITSFVIPSQTDSITIMRYFFLITAGFLGGFGIVMSTLLILLHLVSMHSFGVPYLYPLIPFDKSGGKDTFARFPLRSMQLRPKIFSRNGLIRRKTEKPQAQRKPSDQVEESK